MNCELGPPAVLLLETPGGPWACGRGQEWDVSSYLWIPDLEALWQTIHIRRSQSLAFQDFGPLKKINACSPTILGINLGPIVCNEITCLFFPACLDTLANKCGDTGMDLSNEMAVVVEPSEPCAAITLENNHC